MLEGGFEKGGHSQVMVDVGKPVESRRWCGWSRRHCLFFILVLGAVLFLYNTNIKEMSPNWNHKWWRQYIPFKSHQQNVVHQSSEPTGPEPEPETAVTNSSALPRPENAKGTNATDSSAAPLQQTTKVHQQKTEPPTPVPYVSPGLYLVEYPYEYRFIINEPKKCEEQKPFLVLMVPVAPHNKVHRDIIRSTWGGESSVQGKVVKLFFLLGLYTGEAARTTQPVTACCRELRGSRTCIQSRLLGLLQAHLTKISDQSPVRCLGGWTRTCSGRLHYRQ
ncbi:beta-1,3-galactosyltransferase 2-like [Morone saxatilis]|uniref:beta-1,3-galactosyltransferase 2-like n=1 Tax=Morone saxatilis TaxID=34816 RepID=UPI0015E247C7|nr:beta-1,3-galactosyltransferase 2-like [Morone saxatilis]